MNRSVQASIITVIVVIALIGASGPILAIGGGENESTDRQLVLESSEPSISNAAFAVSTREFDSTTYTITVHEDGTATWTFRHERILNDDSAEAEFESFAETFTEEETDLYLSFVEQAEVLTETGAEETGREMSASEFNRTATVEQRFNTKGIVEMSFKWNEFAVVREDGTVVVGDVFEGGLTILSDQTLVVEAGDDLSFVSAHPEGEFAGPTLENSNSVTWSGPMQFLDGQPRVVLERPSDGGLGATAVGLLGGDRLMGWILLGSLVVLVGLVSVIAYRRDQFPWTASDDAHPQTSDGTRLEESTESVVDPIPEEELLSDEDRVIALIRENGGRMKQVHIVDETGWSKSKVSMLLSEMESDGKISKLRVGRENIISLEGFEPEATKSPFEK